MKILFTFFNWEKKLFWTNKKFVYLIFINKLWWYHPKITYENIVLKDMNKFQVLETKNYKHCRSRKITCLLFVNLAGVQFAFDRIFVLFSYVNSYKIEEFIMDQIKDRIKLVDTTLLSLEQVYTTLSHVSLKKSLFLFVTFLLHTGCTQQVSQKGRTDFWGAK